jgi:Na+-transporting NADH:ubiquinone oxidoreductase subunit C
MRNDSPQKALLVVLLTALVCSTLVSAAVVVLRPIQLNNQLLDKSENIMQITGLLTPGEKVSDEEMLELFKGLDARIVNLDEARFDDAIDPYTFDQKRAANNPELSDAIPPNMDLANLRRRSRFVPVYMVWGADGLDRIILPVRGAGMWSMLYGYIALESDFNTIAGMTFYEQNETPGLGDQIMHKVWLAQWKGRHIYDDQGVQIFNVAEGKVEEGTEAAQFQVDALTGATVTGNAVTALIRYWFGPHGYDEFLDRLRENPPTPAEGGTP